MHARLYTLRLSHPGHAVRLMLEHKGIDHRVTSFPEGTQPVLVHLFGFRGHTVPALKLDGKKLQNSVAIARELDRAVPDPPLYPHDPAARARVEEAEEWGESELQPVLRRILRWSLTEQYDVREWLARFAKLPAPSLQARTSAPLARRFARASGATAERVREDLQELPGKLDRVDALIAAGVLSRSEPNAATFQIGTSVRALTLLPQLERLVAGRPADELARALMPDWPQAPVELPAAWLPTPG